MAQYIQFYKEGSDEPEKLNTLDEEICELVGDPVHPRKYCRLIRPEKSFSRFSGGAELIGMIRNGATGSGPFQHPQAESICVQFGLTVIEWHYWRRITESEALQ